MIIFVVGEIVFTVVRAGALACIVLLCACASSGLSEESAVPLSAVDAVPSVDAVGLSSDGVASDGVVPLPEVDATTRSEGGANDDDRVAEVGERSSTEEDGDASARGTGATDRIVEVDPTSFPESDPLATALGRSEYRIVPTDLLAVTVFQVKDLDREVRVNNAGEISLPLIGAVAVAGRTVDELERDIAAKYQERYLQNPQVSVFLKEFSSQRVTVSGAVKKPGIFPMTSRLTLVQSLALAEGFSEVASHRNVIVFRNVDGERMFARFDVAAIDRGELPDPEIYGDDVVVVDTSTGRQALRTLIQLAPFVAVWRAYR